MKKTIIIFCLKNIALFGAIPEQQRTKKPTFPFIKIISKADEKTYFDPIDEGLEKLFQQTDAPNWRQQFSPSPSTSFFCLFFCLGR